MQGASRWVNTWTSWAGRDSVEVLPLCPQSNLVPRPSSICLFLNCILYKKAVILTVALSWVLCIFQENYHIWRGKGSENSQICSKSDTSAGSLRSQDLWLVSEVEAVLRGRVPSPVASVLTPVVSVRIECTYRWPSWCQNIGTKSGFKLVWSMTASVNTMKVTQSVATSHYESQTVFSGLIPSYTPKTNIITPFPPL